MEKRERDKQTGELRRFPDEQEMMADGTSRDEWWEKSSKMPDGATDVYDITDTSGEKGIIPLTEKEVFDFRANGAVIEKFNPPAKGPAALIATEKCRNCGREWPEPANSPAAKYGFSTCRMCAGRREPFVGSPL